MSSKRQGLMAQEIVKNIPAEQNLVCVASLPYLPTQVGKQAPYIVKNLRKNLHDLKKKMIKQLCLPTN